MMSVVKRISGLQVKIGGEQHTGWLPAGTAEPLPMPVRLLTMDIEIIDEGSGYLLCYAAREERVYGDTWHATLADAEQAAAEEFGVEASQWFLTEE